MGTYRVPKGMSPTEVFWHRVQKTETCWLWTGHRDPRGYGVFFFQGKSRW